MLHHIESWLIAAIHPLLASLVAFGGSRWKEFLEHPTAVLIAAGLGLAVLLLLIGFMLRIVAPCPTLVISNFEMPKDGAPGLHVTGKTLASLLADEMLGIVKGAMSGEWNWGSEFVNVKELHSPLEFTTNPNHDGVEIEVKGVSWGRIASAWKLVRQRRQLLSGDLTADADRVFLTARLPGFWSWRTEPFEPKEASLRTAIRKLAGVALKDLRPFVSGVWELADGNTEEGIRLLENCLVRRPGFAEAAEQLVKPLCEQGRSSEALTILQSVKVPWYKRYDRAVLQKSFFAYYAQQDPVDWKIMIGYARRAARLAPRVPLMQRNLALSAANLGLEKEARRACRRAQKLAPGYPSLASLGQRVEEKLNLARATAMVAQFNRSQQEWTEQNKHADGAPSAPEHE